MEQSESRTRVFISYSHDSTEHSHLVLKFATRLRYDGIDAILDQFVNGGPPEGWSRWMVNSLRASEFAILVCSQMYYRRFLGIAPREEGTGVDWEGHLITIELYRTKSNTVKFIPVLFAPEDVEFIPDPLRDHQRYLLNSEESYHRLYAHLRGQATIQHASLGPLKPVQSRSVEPLTFPASGSPPPKASESSGERTIASASSDAGFHRGPESSNASTAAAGLQEVIDVRAEIPKVDTILEEFSRDFATQRMEIRIASSYKRLHDILHRFQLQCFDPVAAQIQRCGDEMQVTNACRTISITLVRADPFIQELNRAVSTRNVPALDLTWIEDLKQAIYDMDKAAKSRDVSGLLTAEGDLLAILMQQPNELNIRLVSRARAINLAPVKAALQRVHEWLNHHNLHGEHICTVRDGIEALQRTEDNLKRLLDDHDRWQKVELRLRTCESELATVGYDSSNAWRLIKRLAEPLYLDNTVEWARELLMAGALIEDGLARKDFDSANHQFLYFRAHCAIRFLAADTELSEFCTYLENIGNKLAALLNPRHTE